MMNNTQEKMVEAKYFLERMIEFQTARIPFKHNLSAFLSAFRSVTFFMQKEYSGDESFKLWYSTKQKEFDTNEKMDLLNKKRVMTFHHVPLDIHSDIHVSVHEKAFASDESFAQLFHADGTIKKEEHIIINEEPAIIEQVDSQSETIIDNKCLWYFNDYPNSDVITVCEEGTIYLTAIVLECITTFSLK